MGLDLKLLPFFGDGINSNFSHSVLEVPRDFDLFDEIGKVECIDVDRGFTSYLSQNDDYEDTHYGETLETPYGEPLKWTRAESLKKCNFNGAVAAYINELDDKHKIALFWS